MVPWTHLREPMWENAERVDFWIYTFYNLGIHLRNLEQLAFFRVSPVAAVGWTAARCAWDSPFQGWLQLIAVETFFFSAAQKMDRSQYNAHDSKAQDMLSGVVLLSFGYLGEVNQLCT